MSLSYLQSILPIPETEDVEPKCPPKPLRTISEHELGVLLSQFEQFLESLRPYREKLKPIKKFLHHFDLEIDHLSDSLKTLQTQANDLSTGLDSHRSLVERLNPVILDLVVPPSVANSVLKDEIDEKWVENIQFISEKQQLIKKIELGSSTLDYKDSKVFAELKEDVQMLEAKAIERIRNHMIEQIRLLRRSVQTSLQAVQCHLLQIKDAFAFMKARHPQLANQLQLAYIYTMKWYYTTRFAKYLHSLQKLKLKQIDQSYLLGSPGELEASKSGFLDVMSGGYAIAQLTSHSSANTTPSRVPLPEYFLSVPKRMAILFENNDAQRAIPSQIAETTPFAYWLEFAFNQFSTALLDNVIVEYLFAIDFFYQGSEKFDPLQVLDPNLKSEKNKDWSHLMFEEVFKMGHSYANWLVSQHQTLGSRFTAGSMSSYNPSGSYNGTYDSYAVLLMIRIVQRQNATLHNQFHVPVMEDYHNALLLLLWPHFTRIVDLNCDSLKKNIMGKTLFMHTSASHAPIHTTQQFAQFLLGLFKLAFSDDDDAEKQLSLREPVSMSISRLRNDFEGALTKASTHVFGSGKSKVAQREMFLFNNYFLLVTILSNEFEATTNTFVQDQIQHFRLLCDAYKPK
ncbi:hypothetical protein HF325_004484 [Metschnikowia pulcherrima]|uniref:Vps52 / Sac2 family protein n=1 Tax=Metschnikowia pulcherrima TaxID=27326 RepID=A0A8H7GND6_9ASCO|nr:hypothetical protein HF325_004484 [Metschnikowia pulcherrima]